MWGVLLNFASAASGEDVVEALVSAPPQARIDVLRERIVNEPDAELRARLVAVGRLGDRLLTTDEATLRAYVQGMLDAETPDARALMAAAAVDGALDETGAPTLTHDQAMAQYAAHVASLGPVHWYLCWEDEDVRVKVFKGVEVDGVWAVEPFDEDDTGIHTGGLGKVPHHDCVTVDGWSVFIGGEPVVAANDLPGRLRPSPGSCEPYERVVRVVEPLFAGSAATRAPTRWYARPERRPDECLSADDARAWLPSINGALRESLGLSEADAAAVGPGLPPFPTLKACTAGRKRVAEVCSTFSTATSPASVP